MQSMAIFQSGDAHVFKKTKLPKPDVIPGHVLIKVMATSVNPFDIKMRSGVFPDLLGKMPMTLHGDISGVIEQIGEGVDSFAIGDSVFGCVGGLLDMGGGLAEYVLADASLIAHKPKTASFIQAAALPLVSLTAWQGLIDYANVQNGQSVLIHGGTGGVSHIAIQLAKWLGAKVYATSSSSKKMEISKQLGADVTINYKEMNPQEILTKYTHNAGFDVVFDTVGGDTLVESFNLASIFGRVISIHAVGSYDLTPAFLKGLTLHTVMQPLPLITGKLRANYGKILANIASLVDKGIIRPLIDEKQFSISQVGEAHNYLELGHVIGKLVITHHD